MITVDAETPVQFAFLGPRGLTLLIAGGMAYTLSVFFYALQRLPYNDAVWHLFVLGGNVSHYFAVRLRMSVA